MSCRVCQATCGRPFLYIPRAPVFCNVLWDTQGRALQAPAAAISLVFCDACGHIFNAEFDPGLVDYSPAYENSLHFSEYFQAYASGLAESLVRRHGLREKQIIEIGCGNGDFLELLCRLGDSQGVGFDPACSRDEDAVGAVRFIADYYSTNYRHYDADLVCCRHVLEHIENPRELAALCREVCARRPGATVFFEVPNGAYIAKEAAIWDVIYEHCAYFTPQSLGRLFAGCGFCIQRMEVAFGGQYLQLEAVPGRSGAEVGGHANERDSLARDVRTFAARADRKIDEWKERIRQLSAAELRTVAWGAGSKGVTFLNAVGIRDSITHIVDINPKKQGKYVPGTGQQVVPPDFLTQYRPDVVILMNPVYHAEVRRELERMNVAARILTLDAAIASEGTYA